MFENFFGKKNPTDQEIREANKEVKRLHKEIGKSFKAAMEGTDSEPYKQMKEVVSKTLRGADVSFDLHSIEAVLVGMHMHKSLITMGGTQVADIGTLCLITLVEDLRDKRDEQMKLNPIEKAL